MGTGRTIEGSTANSAAMGVGIGVGGAVVSPWLSAGDCIGLSIAMDERGDADPMSWSCSAMSWKNFWSAASSTCGTLMLPSGPPMGGLLVMVELGLGEATPIERPRPAAAGESIGWGVGRCRVIFGSRGSTGVDAEGCES